MNKVVQDQAKSQQIMEVGAEKEQNTHLFEKWVVSSRLCLSVNESLTLQKYQDKQK